MNGCPAGAFLWVLCGCPPVGAIFATAQSAAAARLTLCVLWHGALRSDSIRSQLRDPMQSFFRAVRRLNYGADCYYTQPLTERAFAKVDLGIAADTFARAFSNPAEWTVCLVGAMDLESTERLVRKWLGGIPPRAEPAPVAVKDVRQLPWSFPKRPTSVTVRAPMAEAFSTAQVTWPVELAPAPPAAAAAGGLSATAAADPAAVIEEHLRLNLCVRVLESRLLKLLRFRFGEIYSASATSFFGMEAPSRQGPLRGDVAVRFSCDPQAAPRLARGRDMPAPYHLSPLASVSAFRSATASARVVVPSPCAA